MASIGCSDDIERVACIKPPRTVRFMVKLLFLLDKYTHSGVQLRDFWNHCQEMDDHVCVTLYEQSIDSLKLRFVNNI